MTSNGRSPSIKQEKIPRKRQVISMRCSVGECTCNKNRKCNAEEIDQSSDTENTMDKRCPSFKEKENSSK